MSSTLYILDGHAQIYRAYYAVMGLTSPTGEPTNATFGFCNMLLKLYQSRKPTHVVMAMDAGTAARSEMDANYKAQRKPMPEDMPPQIDRILQIVEMAGMPVHQVEGCEADDVMATLVRAIRRDPAHADTTIYMCTNDKDLDQLIDDKTRMFDVQKGEEIDAAGLFAKKGYWPMQARDVLALTGDTVDNIDGVPGVGPKTAAKWIAAYGSLDGVIANADKITGKIGEALRANLHVLEQSRKLVELMFDLPVTMDWEAARVRLEKLAALAPIFQELGFGRMMGVLQEVAGAAVAARPAIAAATAKPKAPQTRRLAEEIPGGLFGSTFGDSGGGGEEAKEQSTTTEEQETGGAAEESGGTLKPVVGEYTLVNTPEELEKMVAELRGDLNAAAGQPDGGTAGALSVDTETDALGAMGSRLCGISLCAREGRAFYVAVKGAGGDVLPMEVVRGQLGPLLADGRVRKIGQNLKYDVNALRVAGIEMRGIWLDTMVASYVLDSSRLSHGMDALAADLLGLQPIPISDLIGKGAKAISFADVPLDRATGYAAEDADVTLRLAESMHPRLVELKLDELCFNVEMPLVQVLADMEFHGVSIDTALLQKMSGELADRLMELSKKIREAAGFDFNHDSPKQLADVLFSKLKLPVIKKTKTGPSTDIDVLEELADRHPVPALIVEYRQLTKLKNTYLDTLSKQVNVRTGRVHASFNQTVAATGRLSSSDPNLQNIPIRTDLGREIRRAFVARDADHVLITADYSQIELRVLAHYCQDAALVRAFAEDKDVHRVVASEIFSVAEADVTSEQRAIAKTVNFGIIYGQTGFGLSKVLKIPQSQANDFISAYKKRFNQIDKFTQECVKQASILGYVTTILGRRRLIPDIHSPIQARRQFGQRAAMNSVIQGSAADLIKLAMVTIHRRLAEFTDARLIMQIHDELVVECARKEVEQVAAMVRAEMEGAMKLNVPLKVGLAWGHNWLEGK